MLRGTVRGQEGGGGGGSMGEGWGDGSPEKKIGSTPSEEIYFTPDREQGVVP